MAALYRLAARDPEVHQLLVGVHHHLARPDGALREPGLIARVRAELAAASQLVEVAPLAA